MSNNHYNYDSRQWNGYPTDYILSGEYSFPTQTSSLPRHLPDIHIDTNAVYTGDTSYVQNTPYGAQNWSPHSSPDSAELYHAAHNPYSPNMLHGGHAYHPSYRQEPFSPSSANTSSSSGQSSTNLFPTTAYSSTPSTPSSQNSHLSPEDESPRPLFSARVSLAGTRQLYSYKEQLTMFRQACNLPIAGSPGPFIPQNIYKPHNETDQRRYVEEAELSEPIKFWVTGSTPGCGVSLEDALASRTKQLQHRDETVFKGRGPSVSIRINWPGYRPWTKQIPTRDFRKIPGPITQTKLAKGIAKCLKTFISEKSNLPMEDDSDPRWRVGPGYITIEDIMIVSVHHVSMGSWQPQLRLRREFPPSLV